MKNKPVPQGFPWIFLYLKEMNNEDIITQLANAKIPKIAHISHYHKSN